jgi:hypothetical protein
MPDRYAGFDPGNRKWPNSMSIHPKTPIPFKQAIKISV